MQMVSTLRQVSNLHKHNTFVSEGAHLKAHHITCERRTRVPRRQYARLWVKCHYSISFFSSFLDITPAFDSDSTEL